MTETTACAACRYHRRRCTPDCIFRPYFPAEKPTEFKNAHDLFGTNKIKQILKNAHEQGLGDDAAKAIKFQSYVRKKFPVHGCLQLIWDLVNKIKQVNAELQDIRAQIKSAQIKSALAAASQFPTPPPLNHNYFPRDFFSGGDPDSQLPPPPPPPLNHNYFPRNFFSGGDPDSQLAPPPPLNHNYFPRDFFSGGDPESQLPPPLTESPNLNYGYATEFLAAQQALDSLSGETSTHAQQQLPDSDDLAPLTENTKRNYGYATELLAAGQALSLGLPNSNNDGHIQSATNDLNSDGGCYGSFAYGEPTMNHPQQALPNDFFSFDFPTNDDEFIPTKETGDQIAKYMPKDDGNPFS